jgi:hypothetical protein
MNRPNRIATLTTLAIALALAACGSDDSPAPVTATPGQDAAPEATADVVAPDTGDQPEASTDAAPDAELKCEPQSVAGWTPTWHPPTGLYQGICSAAEIQEIVGACWDTGASTAKCNSAKAKYAACTTCLISQETDASYGPIIVFNSLGFSDRNDPGCVALLGGDVSATGCGAQMQAYWQCVGASCSPGCKVAAATFTDDMAAFNDCAQAARADANICKTHYDNFLPCSKLHSDCLWKAGESWAKLVTRIGNIFCGPNPEAGVDGGEADAAGE